jgi:hypothetical protein
VIHVRGAIRNWRTSSQCYSAQSQGSTCFVAIRDEQQLQNLRNWQQLTDISKPNTSAFPEFNMLLRSSWMQFLLVAVVSKYLNFAARPEVQLATPVLWLRCAFWCRKIRLVPDKLPY